MKPPPHNETLKALAEYSSLAFQMLFIILVGYFLGNFLDQQYKSPKRLYAIIGTTTAVVISLIWIIVKLLRKSR